MKSDLNTRYGYTDMMDSKIEETYTHAEVLVLMYLAHSMNLFACRGHAYGGNQVSAEDLEESIPTHSKHELDLAIESLLDRGILHVYCPATDRCTRPAWKQDDVRLWISIVDPERFQYLLWHEANDGS